MFGVVRCDRQLPPTPVPREESLRAAAAARRLDDAFRGFLAERGTKHLPLPDVAALITGVAVLRLTADAVVDLWERGDGGAPAGDRSAARNEVLAAGTQVFSWYEAMANALAGAGDVPPELPPDEAADGRLIDAVQRDLSGTDGQGTAAAVRMIWTADHLDVARRLQARVAGPARQAAAYQRGHGQPWRGQPAAGWAHRPGLLRGPVSPGGPAPGPAGVSVRSFPSAVTLLTGQQPQHDRERLVGRGRPGPRRGTPLAANSGGYSPPTPTPRSKRPPRDQVEGRRPSWPRGPSGTAGGW